MNNSIHFSNLDYFNITAFLFSVVWGNQKSLEAYYLLVTKVRQLNKILFCTDSSTMKTGIFKIKLLTEEMPKR